MDSGNGLFADFVKCLTIMLACQSSEALESKQMSRTVTVYNKVVWVSSIPISHMFIQIHLNLILSD